MMRRIMLVTLVILAAAAISILGLFAVIRYLGDRDIESKEKQAQWLIQKVEEYKKIHHKIPAYMKDLGLNVPDGYPFDYATARDSGVYLIGFQVAPFKSMAYWSDTKKWVMQ